MRLRCCLFMTCAVDFVGIHGNTCVRGWMRNRSGIGMMSRGRRGSQAAPSATPSMTPLPRVLVNTPPMTAAVGLMGAQSWLAALSTSVDRPSLARHFFFFFSSFFLGKVLVEKKMTSWDMRLFVAALFFPWTLRCRLWRLWVHNPEAPPHAEVAALSGTEP